VYDDTPPPPYDDDVAGGTVTPLRRPDHDPAAERALLAALLQNPEIIETALDQLDGDEFYTPHHELIFEAIRDTLQADGVIPDPVTVATHLKTTGDLPKVAHLLPELITLQANPLNVAAYTRTIREHAIRRRALTDLTRALQKVEAGTLDRLDLIADALVDTADNIAHHAAGITTHGDGPHYVTFTGLFNKPKTPTPWAISPILAAGRISLMYSPGKTGKSLIAMEAAAALATGRPALATDHTRPPTHVLYIDQEMTEEDWADRLRDMGYTAADEPLLAEYLHLAQLHAWPPMDTPAGGKAVHDAVKKTGATVVIIDTASKVIAGEENSNDTQQQFYRSTLIPLKREGVAVLVLDHTGKDLEKGARGGSAKTDNIDLAFELIKRGRDTLTLRCTHARFRDDILEQPVVLRRGDQPLMHHLEPLGLSAEAAGSVRPTFLMERVSRWVEANPGQSKTTIETAVKGKAEYVRLALELLVSEHYIETRPGARNATTHYSLRRFEEEVETDD